MKSSLMLLVATAALMHPTTSVQAIAQDITVSVWMHDFAPRRTVDERIVAAFEEQHPNIDIDFQAIPFANFSPRLITSFAGGAGPDLFNQLSTELGQYMLSGFLASFDYEAMGFASHAEAEAHYGFGLTGSVFEGQAFGAPTEVSNWMCVANNTLWERAGLDPVVDAPETWEEMVIIAEQLSVRNDGGALTQRGFDFNWELPIYFWLTFNPMVRQLGVEIIDEETYEPNMNTPEVAQVFEFLAAWVNEEKLGGPQYTPSRDAFRSGELATECSFGIWVAAELRDRGFDYTFFPAPRFENGVSDNGLDAYFFYLMVNSNSEPEVQSAAWQFARFYTDYAVELYSEAGLFSTQPEAVEAAIAADPDIQLFLDELETSGFSPRVAGFNEIGDLLVSARDRILAGEDTAEVLERLQSQAERTLGRLRTE